MWQRPEGEVADDHGAGHPAVQGRRPALCRAHRLRLPQRPDPRRSGDSDPPRRRQPRHGHAGPPDDSAGDPRRHAPSRQGRRPRVAAGAARGRPAIHVVPGVDRTGDRERRALHPGSRNACGQARRRWTGDRDHAAARIMSDAKALEQAGAFSVVLEGMPSKLANTITQTLRIPTIGIGAGPGTDGQVLVLHDMLGLTTGKAPKFVKRYANLAEDIARAATAYSDDVRTGKFPGPEHEYSANGSAPAKDREEVRYGG